MMQNGILQNLVNLTEKAMAPTPVLLPGKSHGQRSLVDCSPWGRWGSDMTKWLHFHFSLSCIGEGNGNPLQCSCLENPRDGEAWWAAVYGVTRSRTRLKWLSNSNYIQVNKIVFELFHISFSCILEPGSTLFWRTGIKMIFVKMEFHIYFKSWQNTGMQHVNGMSENRKHCIWHWLLSIEGTMSQKEFYVVREYQAIGAYTKKSTKMMIWKKIALFLKV